MKNQKGITLIALIITIIVMLILVTVSINVVLDTGLFKATQGVAKNTSEEKDEEISISDGWITILEDDEEKKVHISSFYGTEDIPSVSENPTHLLQIEDFECLIDENTTFAMLVQEFPDFWGSEELPSEYGGTYINYYFKNPSNSAGEYICGNILSDYIGNDLMITGLTITVI